MKNEIWKEVENYPNYQVSNLGNVKSFNLGKERILKPGINASGYYVVGLCKNKVHKTKDIHKLVAITFLNHTPCGHKLVINHKDFNKLNNNVNNLEIITQRENSNRIHLKSSSKYVGVCWNNQKNKWHSQIRINGKINFLGYFENELEAHEAYQNKLKSIL